MLIINYFFFLKFRGFTFVLILNGSHLKRRSALNDVPMAPALKIPVTTRTDGRTVRTFRRRRQLHPPNHLLLPPRLSVWSFLLYTQRLLRPFFFLFCFVIRPVTLDREVGKRTVKEGAGSYKSKKKKKKKRVMTSMAQTARKKT